MVVREDAAAHWIIRKETLFKSCLCDKVAACNWAVAAHATLSRDFGEHPRDKIARENCRCDIVLRENPLSPTQQRWDVAAGGGGDEDDDNNDMRYTVVQWRR